MKFSRLLLAVALFVLLVCIVTAKKHKNKTKKEQEAKKNVTLTRGNFISFDDDDDGDDDSSEDSTELSAIGSSEDGPETKEGRPNWMELMGKNVKETAKKVAKEIEKLKKEKPNDISENLQNDLTPPTKLITEVKDKLKGFTGPLATKVQTKVGELNTKWKTMSETDRKGVAATLGVVASNIEKFGDAESNPIGAVQGAINIVGAISNFFGPAGQLVSIGLSFVSGLLGLFGQGPKPKPLGEIVREQIDEALAKYREETLTDKASGLISAFEGAKAYLDGAAGKTLSESELTVLNVNVPTYFGDTFIGELKTVIKRMLRESKAGDAKKCIKFCELFAQIAGLKDMILTQLMAIHGDKLPNIVSMTMAKLIHFRAEARRVLEPLFTTNFGQKILPYFDPDISVITDSYATSVLDLGKYDRSRAGMYCLISGGKNLVWDTKYSYFHVNGKPYTTTAAPNDNNCYWKLVPHGNYLYSIVNKKGCDSKPPGHWCGSLLSFDILDDEGIVNIEPTDGIMWEIHGNQWNRIRSKWGCGGSSPNSYCDRELRVTTRSHFFRPSLSSPPRWARIHGGKVLPSDGKYYWQLKKV